MLENLLEKVQVSVKGGMAAAGLKFHSLPLASKSQVENSTV